MSGSVELLRAASLADVSYAYAASAAPGTKLLFLAGSCPLAPDGTTVAIGDYPGQAAQCLENLHATLREAGAALADVVSTRVLDLGYEHQLVEVEAVAAIRTGAS